MASKKYRRIINIPVDYLDVIPIGAQLFPIFYEFENALRLAIDKHLTVLYGDWWEKKLKYDLPYIYDYAERAKEKHNKMPWIGDSARVTTLPIHNVTLGHLEEIVKRYQSECIPQLFPTLHFFLGHMDLIKLVRNLYAHMFPCLTVSDARLARSEIITLCANLRSKV
ncbi:MAG: hypothetical protein ACHQ03_07770 [Candidatus Bathyarchaeia archaeon]